MNTETRLFLVPTQSRIVLAMRVREYALRCEKLLIQEGYRVILCPAEVSASTIIETVETYRPDLLIIDDDIDWAEGVPLVLRLYDDPTFATLHFIMLLRRADRLPAFMGYGYSRFYTYISKPFYPEYFVELVSDKLQAIAAGNFPTVSARALSPPRTEDEWQIWRQQLPPFALFEAAWEGDQACVEKLIAQGVDVNGRDWLHKTALQLAVQKNREGIIDRLLEAGADINARDGYGNTPLFKALSFYYMTTIRLLLERGADPNLPNNYETALTEILAYDREHFRERQTECVMLLLALGADPNAIGSLGRAKNKTPLQLARQHSLPVVERLLCDYGALDRKD